MKKIDINLVFAVIIIILGVCGITYGIIEYSSSKNNPLEVHEVYQKTLEYTGFDGKKHQAIVLNTGTHNWVLVEKK